MSNYNFNLFTEELDSLCVIRSPLYYGRVGNGGAVKRLLHHAYQHREIILPSLAPAPEGDGPKRVLCIGLDSQEITYLRELADKMTNGNLTLLVRRLIEHYHELYWEYFRQNKIPQGTFLSWEDDRPQPWYCHQFETDLWWAKRRGEERRAVSVTDETGEFAVDADLHEPQYYDLGDTHALRVDPQLFRPQEREPEREKYMRAQMEALQREELERNLQIAALIVAAVVVLGAMGFGAAVVLGIIKL